MNNAASLVLKAQGLSKNYSDGKLSVSVLKGIDLSISRAEQLAIVGSSGSGKSTLLHLLGGLDHPSSGEITLMGQRFSALSERQRALLRNQYLGFVYQFHHLLPEFSVMDNVAMPLLMRRMGLAQARQEAQALLAQVGLSHRLLHKPAELSGGEKQRTAIARALITRPACLLADEPTGNLDSQTAEQVYQLLLNLQQETGMALVLVTHDLQLARRMSRQIMMRDGRFVDSK
jgi:lipoprotein-releasing system ATP-binding protein